MKNLKVYNKGIKLAATASLVLVTGCIVVGVLSAKKCKYCNHLALYHNDKPVTYKECEGYDLTVKQIGKTDTFFYQVEKDNNLIIYGITSNCVPIQICHEREQEAQKLYDFIGEPKQKIHVK